MSVRDQRAFQPDDIRAALGLLSRMPVRVNPEWAAARGARAAWAYPIAGAIIGACGGIMGLVALTLGFGPGLAAAITLFALALITGGLHEDGLADAGDGLWGASTPERRLAIMEDSRLGAHGAVALILVTLMRWSALSTIFASGTAFLPLIAAGAVSRAPLAVMMQAIAPARPGGLSATVGKPGEPAVWGAVGGAALIGLVCLGAGVFAATLAVILAAFAVARVAQARIGGQTGDILGAAQQLAEAAVLATISAGL